LADGGAARKQPGTVPVQVEVQLATARQPCERLTERLLNP
jgi:hypothetical protein